MQAEIVKYRVRSVPYTYGKALHDRSARIRNPEPTTLRDDLTHRGSPQAKVTFVDEIVEHPRAFLTGRQHARAAHSVGHTVVTAACASATERVNGLGPYGTRAAGLTPLFTLVFSPKSCEK